jgi:enoyl-CoA hydratase/carnithine racemase
MRTAMVILLFVQEVDVGLAADIGTLARLPKITRNEYAIREVAYTAHNFNTREAEKWDLSHVSWMVVKNKCQRQH